VISDNYRVMAVDTGLFNMGPVSAEQARDLYLVVNVRASVYSTGEGVDGVYEVAAVARFASLALARETAVRLNTLPD
jgi:hypothetical protein